MDGFAPLQMGAYGSTYSTNYFSGSLTGNDHRAAYMFRQTNGTVRFLTGRVSNIDEYDASGTRTNRGTSYSGSTADWSMAAWGDQIIACNFLDATQSSTGAGFTALSGAPKARLVASNVNFVMLADTDDGVTAYPDEVYWSALRNPTSWTPSAATQCGRIRLLDAPGPLRAIRAFQQGFIAFKDNSTFVGEFVGPPFVFQWRLISNHIGCVGAKAVAEVDGKIYFLHSSGFYEFDGQSFRNVGLPVFQSFLSEAGYIIPGSSDSYLPASVLVNDGLTKSQAVTDDIEGIVWFKTSYTTNVATYVLVLYGYNVRTGRWSRSSRSLNFVAGDLSPPVVNATSADIQTFKAETIGRLMMIWNSALQLTIIRYPAPSAAMSQPTFTTGLFGSDDSSHRLSGVRWRTLNGTTNDALITVTVRGYTTENKNKTNGTYTPTYNTEFDNADLNASARYHTCQTTWSANDAVLLAGFSPEYAGGSKR